MASPGPPAARMLGRYALYEKIASGGMASVHIGRLLGPVGFARTVAVKRMHPQFAEDPEFVAMFLDEARLAARIRHPNVVPTLDVVATAGELFLVMDYVPGETLARLVRGATSRGERIAPAMVATIVTGVLHGLHAAHEAKSDRGEPLVIVHRDVSPQNILVGTDGVARLLDFGVAKAVGRMHTTREGQLKGKLSYMGPEQIEGTVARTTDVYAAAVVLWEALTGKRLFVGDNEAHVIRRVLQGCDVPPSAHVPDLPRALDDVTMRGLRVDPAERFATARDMARALEDAVSLAATSKVGDWVEEAAKQALDERSARIASIESDSFVDLSPSKALPAPDDRTLTQLSSSSVSSPGPSPTPRKGTRKLVLVAASIAALGAATAVVFGLTETGTSASPAASHAEPPPAASEPEPPSATHTAEAPAAPPTQAVEPLPAPAAEAGTPLVADAGHPAVRAAPARAHAPNRAVSPPAPANPAPSSAPKPAYDPLEHL